MDDEAIVALYWQRNETAIRETHARYGAYCHKIAYQILDSNEDAEECVSDTWWRAWKAIPPQRPSRLRLFLAKIIRNVSFDRFRARTAEKRGGGELPLVLEELEECLAGTGDVESACHVKELGEAVNRFLYALPERERDIFLRRYFYVESAAGIGERYHLKESHVWVILSRTRRKLKEYLQREGYLS